MPSTGSGIQGTDFKSVPSGFSAGVQGTDLKSVPGAEPEQPGTELIPSPYTRCLYGFVLLLLSSCSSPETGYFPTAPGAEWTYDISRTSPESRAPIIQKSIVRNLPARTVDGVTYYPKRYASGPIHYFTISADGISRGKPGHEGADPVIAYPLNVGAEWSAGSRLYLFLPKTLEGARDNISGNLELDYTITSLADSVDVPAGYFPRCLRIDAIGFLDLPNRLMLGIRTIKVEQSQWYAPGVGLVKMTRREYAIPNLYPSEYTQVLTSFKR